MTCHICNSEIYIENLVLGVNWDTGVQWEGNPPQPAGEYNYFYCPKHERIT